VRRNSFRQTDSDIKVGQEPKDVGKAAEGKVYMQAASEQLPDASKVCDSLESVSEVSIAVVTCTLQIIWWQYERRSW